tara:strand:- start:793 stop:1299 length:507 start_codon:yes stop_codon:yes gene_type:complete
MNDNVVQIGVALVIVNLVAWGGFVALEDEDSPIYITEYITETITEYVNETVYLQEKVEIANVTVHIDYNGAEANATANTNITTISYNVTVIGDNSAFNATLEAAKGNFQVTFSWHPSFGVFIESVDGVPGSPCYWELLYNNETSMLGASSLLLAENDSITWKYNTDWC